MNYDPVKARIGAIFNCCRPLRILFYHLLNLLLLRSWYIRREIRKWYKGRGESLNVLDAGSGFGQYVYYVSRLGKSISVKGIDLKSEEIVVCQKFFNKKGSEQRLQFETADLLSFSEPQSFDMVLCIDVLEHITDDIRVMKNLGDSLKPGGALIISTPSDKGGSDAHNHDDQSFIGEHVRNGYGKEELTSKLISAGFSDVEIKYSYGRFGQASWRLSMKIPILMLNYSKLFYLLLPLYYIVTFPIAFIMNLIDLHSVNRSGTGIIAKAYKRA